MIIDDSEVDCYLSKSLLEVLEIAEQVDCVYSGVEALDYVLKTFSPAAIEEGIFPELIFLDINMPLMDGFEFLKALQAAKSIDHSKLYIVMLTSSINMDDIKKAADLWDLLKEYITKPLVISAVKNILATLPVKE